MPKFTTSTFVSRERKLPSLEVVKTKSLPFPFSNVTSTSRLQRFICRPHENCNATPTSVPHLRGPGNLNPWELKSFFSNFQLSRLIFSIAIITRKRRENLVKHLFCSRKFVCWWTMSVNRTRRKWSTKNTAPWIFFLFLLLSRKFFMPPSCFFPSTFWHQRNGKTWLATID